MTNRNRKKEVKPGKELEKSKKDKSVEAIKKDNSEREKKMETPALIISVVSIAMSIITLIFSSYQSNREYEYKLDPEIESTTEIGIQIEGVERNRTIQTQSEEVHINILQKNNLQTAYLIHSDHQVEKLEIDEAEETLESTISDRIEMGKPDFTIGSIDYQYVFILLKGLDGTMELYLIYLKSDGNTFTFNGVSEAEVWGLANAHEGDGSYEGEKKMAAEYLNVLEGCRAYVF